MNSDVIYEIVHNEDCFPNVPSRYFILLLVSFSLKKMIATMQWSSHQIIDTNFVKGPTVHIFFCSLSDEERVLKYREDNISTAAVSIRIRVCCLNLQ